MWRPHPCNGNTFRRRSGTRRCRLRPMADIPRSPPPHDPPRSTRPAWWAREERLLCRRERRWPASPTERRMARMCRPRPVRRTQRGHLLPVSHMAVAAARHTADRRANRGRQRPRRRQDRKDSPQRRPDRKDSPWHRPDRRVSRRNSLSSGRRRRPRAKRASANGTAKSLPRPGGRRSSKPGHHRIS